MIAPKQLACMHIYELGTLRFMRARNYMYLYRVKKMRKEVKNKLSIHNILKQQKTTIN